MHSSECKEFVDKYVDIVIDYIENDVPFDKICSLLQLCSMPTTPKPAAGKLMYIKIIRYRGWILRAQDCPNYAIYQITMSQLSSRGSSITAFVFSIQNQMGSLHIFKKQYIPDLA